MLQPAQLDETSLHFETEVKELRSFLRQANVSTQATAAISELVSRLQTDAFFRRDIVSQVWEILSGAKQEIRSSDLLRIVMLAAAGLDAAKALPDETHVLLRFLIETRASFDSPGKATVSKTNQQHTEEWLDATASLPFRKRGRNYNEDGEQPEKQGLGSAWPRGRAMSAAALCMLLVSIAGFIVLKRSESKGPSKASRTVSSNSPVPVLPVEKMEKAENSTPDLADQHIPESSISGEKNIRKSSDRRLLPTTGINAVPSAIPARNTSTVESLLVPPSVDAVGPMIAPVPQPPIVLPPTPSIRVSPLKATSQGKVTGKIVDPAELSRQLGARTLPAYEAGTADGEASNRHYPRLLRRHPESAGTGAASASAPSQNVASVQENLQRAMSLNGTLPRKAGTVTPTALGIMAGNVVYSPSPEYPAAAAMARVQGEVRVQAEIDRDGTVSYARIVSGPPMLRDAALDAVQHWRYRPYLSGGKPIPMTTLAVVEFELP